MVGLRLNFVRARASQIQGYRVVIELRIYGLGACSLSGSLPTDRPCFYARPQFA